MNQFFMQKFLGLEVFMWYIIIGGLLIFLTLIAIAFWEKTKTIFYRLFKPERVFKIILHYPNSMYKRFYRIIPDNNLVKCKGGIYIYDSKLFEKGKDIDDKERYKLDLEGKEYTYNKDAEVKTKSLKDVELHYFYGIPNPIIFKTSDEQQAIADLSTKELEAIKKNDLFLKLLSLEQQEKMMTIIILLVLVNTIISGFMLAKSMGWLE